MLNSFKRKKGVSESIPPLIFAFAAAILIFIILIMAARNIHREKAHMSRILSEKGAAIIRAVEAGARMGMMRMMWGGGQVQILLEEAASQDDILYLLVTNEDGVILAHSTPSGVGRSMDSKSWKDIVKSGPSEKWRIVKDASGKRAFEVYRHFRPMHGPGMGRRRGGDAFDSPSRRLCPEGLSRFGGKGGSEKDWCFANSPGSGGHLIFVGLNMQPFENAQRRDVRSIILISAFLALLGVAGFLALFWLNSYRSTRRMLQDASAFADEVVASLPVGLIAADPDGRIAFFNHAAEKITGRSRHDAIGRPVSQALGDDSAGLARFFEPGEQIVDKEMEWSFDGEATIPLSISASGIINEEGSYVGRILILRDLRELKQLQEQVRRQEKLSAIGGLAAGVAHEIRNPLSSIKGLASYFGGKFDEGSEDRETADVLEREADRLNRVVSQLLDFARPSDVKMKNSNVNRLIDHSVSLVRQDAKMKNIAILTEKDENLPEIPLDRDRIAQCLLNLYLNSIAAMDEGGALTVRSMKGPGNGVIIEVEDVGRGIESRDMNRIFDPYFTTKASGTGLGLAIVHKIIESHGADISVKSAPGRGTVFTISLKGDRRPE